MFKHYIAIDMTYRLLLTATDRAGKKSSKDGMPCTRQEKEQGESVSLFVFFF
jgi:hypothetical protein